MLVMLLQASGGNNLRWINILIWYLFIPEYLEEANFSESQKLSCCVLAMSTKLHQKLVEDIRLQKRLLGLIDERNNVIKEQRGSYYVQAPRQEIEVHEKRLVNVRSSWEDDGDKAYAWDDRRNSSRRRRDGREASRGRHELASAAHGTLTSSKPVKPLPELAISYYSNTNNISDLHRQQQREERYKVNSINKNAAGSSGNGARRQEANDERSPGAFANSMHILAAYSNNSKNFRKTQDHHRRQNRSLDLGEVDAPAIHSNAQATSFMQISKDALKLGDILKKQQGNGDRDLLKGAMDLEESLRILARLQKAAGGQKTVERRRQSVDLKELLPFSKQKEEDEEEGPRPSFDGWREPPRLSLDAREFGKSSNRDLRDAIRTSLSRQKLLYGKNSGNINFRSPDSDSVPNSGILQVVAKKRIPNVIARLMGLDEMPSDSSPLPPDAVPNRIDSSRSLEGGRGLKPEKPRLQETIRRPILQTAQPKDFVRDVHVKEEEDDDTIMAALKRIKQQVPPKLSFQEELSEKLKRLHSVEPQQERKTLKQILEAMEVKGLLRPAADQSKQKVEDDLNHRETIVLKPVTARRVQEQLQEKGKPSKSSNKSLAKEASSQSDIVLIKPLNADSSAGQRNAQSPSKATELHPEINPVKSTEPKKNKNSNKAELGKPANDGQSKKKNSLINPEGALKSPKQRTENGAAQKHSKSQLPPPSPSVLQEIKRRRSDRISKVNNKKVPSKPEKQKPVRSKAKESVSRLPRPASHPSPTYRIPSKVYAKHATPIPVQPINQNASAAEMNGDTNEAKSQLRLDRDEETPENRNVKSLHPVSQDENSESELSSGSIQRHNSSEESTSPIAVLKPPAEADSYQDDEEETADDENEGEEHSSSLPNHLEGSDDSNNKSPDNSKSHSFAVSDLQDPDPSNYADDKELMTAGETNYKDYVRQILTRIPAFMNAEATELAELYPRLYFKLEEQEAASISGQEDIKQGHSGDALERQLVMDCIKELLKRKARLRLQMKQPVKLARIKRAPMGLKRRKNIQELVIELSDDIGDLMAYHNKPGGDFVQNVLRKDLNNGNIGVNSVWNPSWDNGLHGEDEAQEIGRDVEKLIFDDLLEEVVLQFWVPPEELCSG